MAHWRTATGVCLICWLALSVPARAEKIIDTFDTTVQLLQRGTVGATTGNAVAAETIGGQRDLALTVTAAPMGGTMHTLGTNLAGSQKLEYFETNGNGFFTVVWDGDTDPDTIDYTGLLDQDLTEGGVNTGILLSVAADLSTDITLTIFDNMTDFSSLTVNLPGGGGLTELFYRFSDFVPSGGGADFSSVGAIELSIAEGPSGNDVEIDFVAAVPEPHSWLLLSIGAAIVYRGRPRRHRRWQSID